MLPDKIESIDFKNLPVSLMEENKLSDEGPSWLSSYWSDHHHDYMSIIIINTLLLHWNEWWYSKDEDDVGCLIIDLILYLKCTI